MSRLIRSLVFLGALLAVLGAVSARAAGRSPFLDYRSESWFLPQSPGVAGGPAAGLFNPAAAALSDVGGADIWWNDGDVRRGLDNYGLAAGRTLNFALNTTTYGTRTESWKVYDYQLGVALGDRSGTFGLAYRWSRGETDRTPREKALVLGAVGRRDEWLSYGASGVLGLESPAARYVFDVGVRPFGRDYLTLFADWTLDDEQAFFQDGTWGAGFELRPHKGVHLGGRAQERAGSGQVDYSILAGLTLGWTNYSALPRFDRDGDRLRTSYLIRSRPAVPGLSLRNLKPGRKTSYYPLNLEHKVLTYQKYRYFDDRHLPWLDLLPLLDAVRDDPHIDIVVVNLAGFDGRPSLIWEFRQKLREIRAAGKELIVHTDRTNARTYYLASVADRISIDPYGSVSIPGLALSRSYLKGTLEKLGIGFQAQRYYKYKSAVETLSRDSMSAADREQRQRLVDVIHEEFRDGMAAGRRLSAARVDEITDDEGFLVAGEAVDAGLVDQVTRWEKLLDDLETRRDARAVSWAPSDYPRRFWDRQWGRPAQIPVVYAVGACAMDSGIKGRRTSAYLRGLIHDPRVKAVVLRADSPGGDPLPSDLVADAVRQLRAAGKPVIVSQGDVAASGGYWISMDGTRILTTPLTITGSIGVISGWVWDDGMAAKAGVTSDEVHRGKHADLYAQVRLPLIGGLPRRPMDGSEMERAEVVIRGMYHQFVSAVAQGRGLAPQQVEQVAQGRVWMGGDAIDHGLCDQFGGLDQALALARSAAGIADWREVAIVEYPPRPLVKWPRLGPRIPGLFGLDTRLARLFGRLVGAGPGRTVDETPTPAPGPSAAAVLSEFDHDYLGSLIRTRGQAALLVAPDILPEAWRAPHGQ